jgi:hypothetical protein
LHPCVGLAGDLAAYLLAGGVGDIQCRTRHIDEVVVDDADSIADVGLAHRKGSVCGDGTMVIICDEPRALSGKNHLTVVGLQSHENFCLLAVMSG